MSKVNPQERRELSRQIRILAAQLAYFRSHPVHQNNKEENDLPKKMMNFTKGLPHDHKTGLIQNEDHFKDFVKGICNGDLQTIANTPLGPNPTRRTTQEEDWKSKKARDLLARVRQENGEESDIVRGWESAGAGLTFDLQSHDAQAVTMISAPKLGSDELTAEIAEVYAQAKLRDVRLEELTTDTNGRNWHNALSKLKHFRNKKRKNFDGSDFDFTIKNMFRGLTPGDLTGPYISQFLLAGNNGLNQRPGKIGEVSTREFTAKDGYINYGAIVIDQRVRNASTTDYMTNWDEYIDVQNGADFRGLEEYEIISEERQDEVTERRFITTGRDLATYVHYDALYEAYLNACLFLLGIGAPFDEGIPFQGKDYIDKQQGFAHFGGPHILTLVTEVATRALKAVRFQKFNVHRRLRPEAFAARLERKDHIKKSLPSWDSSPLDNTFEQLEQSGVFDLLGKNRLLPMAFCEGSPMHPAYGAGHATVAGACVTILKAFFNDNLFIDIDENGESVKLSETPGDKAFVPNDNGTDLQVIDSAPLTLRGELNKLAANISIGRNWAGVHYFTDYSQSMLLGEEIAIGLLEEQMLTYNTAEKFSMTLTKFNGDKIQISKRPIITFSEPPIA